VQVIAAGASCVKIRKFHDDSSVPKQRWFCKNCFADAKASRTLAMSVDRTRTEKILELIAAKQDAAAAVPPPPSIHSTPTRMAQPHAVARACCDAWTSANNVLRAACTFRNRAASDIARRQAHAGGFDRPAGGGSFSCRGHARDGREKRVGRG
jgi:hypothetical protein